MSNVFKEIIIMLLICLAVMIVFAISLYQWIPNRKIIPEIEIYAVSEEIEDLLEDDIEERTKNNGNSILTYTSSNESIDLTSSDLSTYEKNYDYVPGKTHPFAETVESIVPEEGQDPESIIPDETGSSENQQEEITTPRVETTEPSAYSSANGSK